MLHRVHLDWLVDEMLVITSEDFAEDGAGRDTAVSGPRSGAAAIENRPQTAMH